VAHNQRCSPRIMTIEPRYILTIWFAISISQISCQGSTSEWVKSPSGSQAIGISETKWSSEQPTFETALNLVLLATLDGYAQLNLSVNSVSRCSKKTLLRSMTRIPFECKPLSATDSIFNLEILVFRDSTVTQLLDSCVFRRKMNFKDIEKYRYFR